MSNVRVNCVCPNYVETAMVTETLDQFPEQERQELLKLGLIS